MCNKQFCKQIQTNYVIKYCAGKSNGWIYATVDFKKFRKNSIQSAHFVH